MAVPGLQSKQLAQRPRRRVVIGSGPQRPHHRQPGRDQALRRAAREQGGPLPSIAVGMRCWMNATSGPKGLQPARRAPRSRDGPLIVASRSAPHRRRGLAGREARVPAPRLSSGCPSRSDEMDVGCSCPSSAADRTFLRGVPPKAKAEIGAAKIQRRSCPSSATGRVPLHRNVDANVEARRNGEACRNRSAAAQSVDARQVGSRGCGAVSIPLRCLCNAFQYEIGAFPCWGHVRFWPVAWG
jgi:hypothetical protein